MITHQLTQRIKGWISENQRSILDLVTDLVKYNTVNQVLTGTEKDCQLHIQQLLSRMGLESDLFSPEDVAGFHRHEAYFPGKDYSDRPNVVGKLCGVGNGKSLIFSSHIDTAVVAPGWSRNPYETWIEDDKLYGLGTFDMKGGLAASIMALRCLMELGIKLNGDVLIESVVDEEFGGANGTLASRLRGYNPTAAIIPEPTNLAICPATRGGALWRVTFRGTTGLSFSGEKTINPVNTASKFIVFLEEFEQERAKRPGPAPWYEHDSELPVIVTRLEAGDMKAPLCDAGPTECHVDVWVECHPGTTEESLQQELLQGFAAKYGEEVISGPYAPEFRKMIRFLHASEVVTDDPLLIVLKEEVERVTGETAAVYGAPFACDAFMFNLYSPTPAIILGPKGANAHAPDEYLDIPAFYKLIEIYVYALINWCGIAEISERGM